MNIKKTLSTLFVSSLLIAGSTAAYAEEPADNAKYVAETIAHIEAGIEEAKKSDFSAATLHLKDARHSSGEIRGHELAINKAVNDINKGMREVKLGHPEESVAALNEAIEIYKGL